MERTNNGGGSHSSILNPNNSPFSLRTGNQNGGVVSAGEYFLHKVILYFMATNLPSPNPGGSSSGSNNSNSTSSQSTPGSGGGGSILRSDTGSASNVISLLPTAHHLNLNNLHVTAQHIFAQHAVNAAAAAGSGSEGHVFNPGAAAAAAATPFFVHHSAGLLQILMAAERCQVRNNLCLLLSFCITKGIIMFFCNFCRNLSGDLGPQRH